MAGNSTRDRCQVTSIDPKAVERAVGGQPAAEELQLTAETFAAFGDPTRLSILIALASGELCVCDLAAVIDATQSAVSHQLRSLRQQNLVKFRREGKRAVYSLADDHVTTLLRVAAEHARERIG